MRNFICVLLNLLVNMVWIAGEEAIKFIIVASVLVIQISELFELEVVGGTPVELLHGELIVTLKVDTHCDKVVSFESSDLSPKEEFVKVCWVR